MNTSITNIDYQSLIETTGDPFADVGGYVIKYLSVQNSDKDIVDLIELMAKIYVNAWSGKLNAFFLNSTITQPAFQGEKKFEETMKFYKSLINETLPYKEGYCRVTGKKTKLFLAGRDNHILSGSGTFINFHSSFEAGLYLSKEVLIRIFFVPFGLVQLGDKIALINSNYDKVTEFFVFQNCYKNSQDLGIHKSEGVLKSDFINPANVLFGFADSCIQSIGKSIGEEDISEKDVMLNLYHFTNFGASPEVQLYQLPASVFKFYVYCLSPFLQTDWKNFVYAHYRNSKVKEGNFNEQTGEWQDKKESFSYDRFKTWRNSIYDKLLFNQSILREILNWSIKHRFNFKIVETYQIRLKNMDKKAIEKIKDLADFIVTDQSEDLIKKSITRLNGEKFSQGLRQFIVKQIADNYNRGAKNPLITIDDFVNYLFPDGTSWKDVRDLLLIAIYQKLHETNIKFELEISEAEPEPQNPNEQ
ncbi:type I-B CRISPR-associated protein Cas8b1/Cst1 [Cytophagaceae bacterium YF14B1]|uniref:Type I-B CRISPR-associated protein Cas8b1/Cst1 n=1 Tax=Xanthocytophaga flava TaxID=3048013 RepID=A0AAE3UBF7_9BACT|nr:type I-B CRISPR-associated protein Cas8b1/Cst1 [Xanthocytophaga flavus]MDJ1485732.1 type I-B CRISPR-associated protein Cas8b1/Cst1 [Xanthocytophaga flavus]